MYVCCLFCIFLACFPFDLGFCLVFRWISLCCLECGGGCYCLEVCFEGVCFWGFSGFVFVFLWVGLVRLGGWGLGLVLGA